MKEGSDTEGGGKEGEGIGRRCEAGREGVRERGGRTKQIDARYIVKERLKRERGEKVCVRACVRSESGNRLEER